MEDAVTVESKFEGYAVLNIPKEVKPVLHHARKALQKVLNAKSRRGPLPPAFLDGYDTEIIVISSPGLFRAEMLEGVGDLVVLSKLIHNVAFVCSIEEHLIIIVKDQDSDVKYKCFVFDTGSSDSAGHFASILIGHANDAFLKLREASKDAKAFLPQQKPTLPPRAVNMADDEDQPWFHGIISREKAEQLLSRNLIGGLYLVRKRETSDDYVLSFTWKGKIYHNLITRRRDGTLVNINQTHFDSLKSMITAYQSPHIDLQTVLTEYVPNTDDGDEEETVEEPAEYANLANLRVTALSQPAPKEAPGSALARRLSRRVNKFLLTNDIKASSDINFDPIYNDESAGFGEEFVKYVLNLKEKFSLPPDTHNLESADFNAGDIDHS